MLVLKNDYDYDDLIHVDVIDFVKFVVNFDREHYVLEQDEFLDRFEYLKEHNVDMYNELIQHDVKLCIHFDSECDIFLI